MEEKYIIFDIKNNEYFIGCDDDGKPIFSNLIEINPITFDSEVGAKGRLFDEIELFGKWFLLGRIIEIKKVIIFN